MAGQRRKDSSSREQGRASISGPLVLFCVVVLGCGAGYAWHESKGGAADTALDRGAAATTTPVGGSSAQAAPKPSRGRNTDDKAPTRPSSTATKPIKVPKSGTGVFSTAQASGSATGHGAVRRYKVQVEGGIDLSSADAAHEIAGILADPRGWTADGHDAFQLVSSGSADFVIKIATPDTVDAICGEAGLLTRGEVNCDVGATVVVNLKRWVQGSPEFNGPIHDYRALIINHEVGHRIGHGHEGCPGPGKPAPVMMQQIKGLHGCVANAWPYDSKGHYLQGPPTA